MIEQEEVPLNIAELIGKELQGNRDISTFEDIPCFLGNLHRLNGPVNTAYPSAYQQKKHVFELRPTNPSINPIIVIHYSSAVYGQDQTYYERGYQFIKTLYETNQSPRLVPEFYAADDTTRTLALREEKQNLSEYIHETDEEKLQKITKKIIETFQLATSYRNTQTQMGFPRYVEAFLKPEYTYLENFDINTVYTPSLTSLYLSTQRDLKEYLRKIMNTPFLKGFGTPDCKLENLAETHDGNVVFLDIDRYSFNYHWLSLFGSVYEEQKRRFSDKPLTKVLQQTIRDLLQKENNPEQALQLFVIGMLNNILIPCTIRNIAFMHELNAPIRESLIYENLSRAQRLLAVQDIEEIL